MEIAAETSGHAVVVSGFAVIISMAGLLLAGDVVFSSLAVGSILVVAVAVIGSLTVLPALLAKLGRWVDRPRVPLLWRLTAPRTGRHGQAARPRFWPARAAAGAARPGGHPARVGRRCCSPWPRPALGMKLKFPGMEDLPRTTPAMQAYDRLTAAFPSNGTSHTVAVRAPAGPGRPGARPRSPGWPRRAATDPLFAPAEADGPKIEVSADRRVSVLEVATPYASRADQAAQSLHEAARGPGRRPRCGGIPGVEYAVGGGVAASEDYADHVRDEAAAGRGASCWR